VGGLVVDIQPPDLETKLAILAAKAEQAGQSLPNEVLNFLAGRIHSNIRELEGCLNRLAAYAQITARAITLDLVKGAVADILRPASRRRLSDTTVLEAVCAYYSVDKETIVGRRRDKHTALARQVAMYLLREESNLPFASIGRILGGKDHSTVLHACRRISDRIDADSHLHRDLVNIREALTSP
jgi:chromosomal replication initiator protein